MAAIKVEKLTKAFSGLVAVDSISFEIKEGEIFGLLGPNGAGKTTTISMLSTVLKPTSGTATVNGIDILKDEDGVRKSIGIVFQDPSLDEELTAYENMDFHGRLYGVEKNDRKKRIAELLELVGLYDRKDDIVKKFSGGMRRRLEIARGLMHQPKVLFLDEPTLGLDPQTRNNLWEHIERLNREKGMAIILTTHYMEEADRLCHRVAIIDKGKIVAMDTPQKLKAEIGGDIVTIMTPDAEKTEPKIKAPWVKRVEARSGILKISLQDSEKHVTGLIKLLSRNRTEIKSISISKPTLEDVFLHFTGRMIREEGADSKDAMRMRRRLMRR